MSTSKKSTKSKEAEQKGSQRKEGRHVTTAEQRRRGRMLSELGFKPYGDAAYLTAAHWASNHR